jgi:hypothetical protein
MPDLVVTDVVFLEVSHWQNVIHIIGIDFDSRSVDGGKQHLLHVW